MGTVTSCAWPSGGFGKRGCVTARTMHLQRTASSGNAPPASRALVTRPSVSMVKATDDFPRRRGRLPGRPAPWHA